MSASKAEPDDREWLNVTQAAKYAGIGRRTLYDWINDNKLPFPIYPIAYRIRKCKKSDIDSWLASVREGPGEGPVFPRKHK
jgi:excisionase family DNA binding protein